MIQKIRTSKFSKVIASYLALQLIVQMAQPSNLWALTSGPSQPEFNSFTPIGTSDMVNLASGNFNYNIPIMDVGGYPINLAYDSGVTMDQEASWVGLGWNLNVGQINRQVRGIPDDFKGDEMKYETNIKDNVTVGVSAQLSPQLLGFENEDAFKASVGVNLRYNNYSGISFTPSFGLSFDLANVATVGMDVQNSAEDGITISPSISGGAKLGQLRDGVLYGSLNAGVSTNSRRGITDLSINSGLGWWKDKPLFDGKFFTIENKVTTSAGISFSRPTLTPRKRTAFKNTNGTVSVSLGPDVYGLDKEIEISAMGSIQKVKENQRVEKAYGYEFTGHAKETDILDYNRQNDQIISKATLSLPVTNYTYDLYAVNGQGINGMFRGFRSQVGQVNDELVRDESDSYSVGVEIEGGAGFHVGGNFVNAPSESSTGVWNTKALKHFKQTREDVRSADENLDYEPVYHKFIGEPRIDENRQMFNDLGGYAPIALQFSRGSGNFENPADSRFAIKEYTNGIARMNTTALPAFPSSDYKFKVRERERRNQNIQKLTVREIKDLYKDDPNYYNGRLNKKAKDHHTAEIRILKPDGATYIFGETAYNTKKIEATFAVDGSREGNCGTGLVDYATGSDNSVFNNNGVDHFFDRVNTPAYAHTYLLSSVLSSDYEDLTSNGPTLDDLGAYTQFDYFSPTSSDSGENFKWRIPYQAGKAAYNAGLNTVSEDQKGNYIYGEKEIKYVKRIRTKTHVAVFDLSPRKDGRGVSDENGRSPGQGISEMYKIKSIRLYSRPEYEKALEEEGADEDNLSVTAIKTAHFVYDYSLAQNVPNNLGGTLDPDCELSNDFGKLTLKSVYFTYRASQMGKYTPYVFNYDSFNPEYNLKSYDVWGNYKPVVEDVLSYQGDEVAYELINGREVPITNTLPGNENYCGSTDALTAPEYPYVQQTDKKLQDALSAAWSLTSIDLPSGGRMEVTYESDDYNYVQDKNAMQMFKVVGAGFEDDVLNTFDPSDPDYQKLYTNPYRSDGSNDVKYLYVALPEETDTNFDFDAKYLKGIKAADPAQNKPIYFRFSLNMTQKGALYPESRDYDYVSGYFLMDPALSTSLFKPDANGPVYAAIPMAWVDLEGGVQGMGDVNPISKAGWYFGRKYLNNEVYGLASDMGTDNFETIAKKVAKSFDIFTEIIKGANGRLRSNELLCSQRFNPEKSWIRLATPNGHKRGGGVRVKQLVMKDQWEKMVTGVDNDNERYSKKYGQEYSYTLDDGTSSGVATYEPAMSKENPWVEPLYNKGIRLQAPKEVSYVEKPLGADFFPSPSVTYSRVSVKNLERANITDHATGKVVTTFFTSRDFPTKVDMTDLDVSGNSFPDLGSFAENLIRGVVSARLKTQNKFGLSQGYVIHTNDMNGKMRTQEVFAENASEPISTVTYKYATKDGNGRELESNVPLVGSDGRIRTNASIGVDYDVVTDFRESRSVSKTDGLNANLYIIGTCPLCLPFVKGSLQLTEVENVAQTVITTKVIHTTGILKEKIATDLGASVSTINEAWDSETGAVLLTRTVNEYDDEYFNFNFPAYWAYPGMGQASKSVGIKGELQLSGDVVSLADAQRYLYIGDELLVGTGESAQRLWVVRFNGNEIVLINDKGVTGTIRSISGPLTFTVVRSGYRNQQMANMASVTMMTNPLLNKSTGAYLENISQTAFVQAENSIPDDNIRVVNASAVEYDDLWNCQCEGPFSTLPKSVESSADLAGIPLETLDFNPFLFNVKGEWRAKRSFAYLTERTKVGNADLSKRNTRREGYFKAFEPFYTIAGGAQGNRWQRSVTEQAIDNEQKWTFASEVTEYSPFGAELENRDALKLSRYSAAQYGYNYTLPTAVASNSRYKHMGADGFEDYDFLNSLDSHFNFKTSVDEDGPEGASISYDRSHTGISSLVLREGDDAYLFRELLGEVVEEPDRDGDGIADDEDLCPDTADPSNSDNDRNGIGDVCEDDIIPVISDVLQSGQYRCRTKQLQFYINGRANQTVEFQIVTVEEGPQGWSRVFINGEQVDKTGRHMARTVTLDDTGRKKMQLEFHARRREGGDPNNIQILVFLNSTVNGPAVSTDFSEFIPIKMFGGKCTSGNDPGAKPIF